jgi:hypothetical protein
MLAPRRIGKTWLMGKIADDLTAEGWLTIHIEVAGIRTENDFLRLLCRKLQEAGTKTERAVAHLKHRLSLLASGGWEGNPIDAIGKINTSDFAEELISSLNQAGRETLILVDEIALFLMQYAADDPKSAYSFLYNLRRLRQSYGKVRWLFTGSIGLDVIARRQQLHGALVDLDVFVLRPFTEHEASSLIQELCQQKQVRHPFGLGEAEVAHLAAELGWLAPYYLRIVSDHIIPSGNGYLQGLPKATCEDIGRALDTLLEPPYRPYFSTWEEHLDKNFEPQEAQRLHDVLLACCEQPLGETFATLLVKMGPRGAEVSNRELKNALTTLSNNGFLCERDSRWQFQSGLLRRYWLRYIHE